MLISLVLRAFLRIFIFVWSVCLSACSADLDWRETTLNHAAIKASVLMPSKPQQHQTQLTQLAQNNTKLSSNELISRVEIGKTRGLFVLAVAEVPKSNLSNLKNFDTKTSFLSFVQTQQNTISKQLKQTILQRERLIFSTKQLTKTPSDEQWLVDPDIENSLRQSNVSSNTKLNTQKMSHISRFLWVQQGAHSWIVQQTYRGNLALTQEELVLWFSSLNLKNQTN